MNKLLALLCFTLVFAACDAKTKTDTVQTAKSSYFDNTGRDDAMSGGVKMITIDTPKGKFRVWTQRIGNNPRIKVLLLHGGPGATHEYLMGFNSIFPGEGIEYYYYDQLGSGNSDTPTDLALWEIPRFVEEVEQVRKALGLKKDNFYLFGNSWGGMLAMEYALKYQENLKGLIVSNMMASIPEYVKYADTVLKPAMNQETLKAIEKYEAEKKFTDEKYQELLMTEYYQYHLLRMPPDQWPDPVVRSFAKMNHQIYEYMQGPSEMGITGTLLKWDRVADLPKITVPTLVIGAKYDTMDPAHMEMMSKKFPKGRYLYCPNGSHLALYDDREIYANGIVSFIKEVDSTK